MERLFDRTALGLTPGPVAEEEIYASLALPAGVAAAPDTRPLRPYTVINMVMTVDGKTVVGGPSTTPLIGSPVDHRLMVRINHQADAVIMGAGLIRADNPPYPRLSDELRRRRAAAGLLPDPLYAVVTTLAQLPVHVRIFDGPPGTGVVFAAARAPADRLDDLRGRARVFTAGAERVEADQLARLLIDELSVRRLVCLGGASLNALFVEGGIADELFVTLAPKIHGGSGLPSAIEGHGWPAEAMPRLDLLSAYRHQGELFLRYRLPTAGGAKGS